MFTIHPITASTTASNAVGEILSNIGTEQRRAAEKTNEYVDDESALAVCKEFAEHLAGCNPCQVVVDNIRQSNALYKAGQPYPMPPEFEARMRNSLQERHNF